MRWRLFGCAGGLVFGFVLADFAGANFSSGDQVLAALESSDAAFVAVRVLLLGWATWRLARGKPLLVAATYEASIGHGETMRQTRGPVHRVFATCFWVGLWYFAISYGLVWIWDRGANLVGELVVAPSIALALVMPESSHKAFLLLHVAVGGLVGFCMGKSNR